MVVLETFIDFWFYMISKYILTHIFNVTSASESGEEYL